MATPYQNMDPETGSQKCCRICKKVTLGGCCTVILVVCVVQAVLYKWATLKCSASHLKDYEYPGGGPVELVPLNSLLVEQEPRWWGSSFINVPTDEAGLATEASSGVFYKTWGPIFNTYTYQDIMSRETFVIRDRPLALGGSHKIMRCDGTGPSYVFSEGTHWLMNHIREMFGMYASRQYNIWEGNKKVAVSQKVGGAGQSHKQLVFRAPDKDTDFASCFLKSRQYHGQFDEWFVQESPNVERSIPAFVPHSCCVLMAFRTAEAKVQAQDQTAKPAGFLEQEEPSAQSTVLDDDTEGGVEGGVVEIAKQAVDTAAHVAEDAVDEASEAVKNSLDAVEQKVEEVVEGKPKAEPSMAVDTEKGSAAAAEKGTPVAEGAATGEAAAADVALSEGSAAAAVTPAEEAGEREHHV